MDAMENRRELLKFAAVLGTAGVALPAAGMPHIPDSVVKAPTAKLIHEPFGDHRVFFEGATSQLKSMTAGSLHLKAGMEPHPPHQHPEEEFMLITEGSGEFLVNGKTVPVGPGSMMYCEGNQVHGIKNTSSAPLLFYYYKWQA